MTDTTNNTDHSTTSDKANIRKVFSQNKHDAGANHAAERKAALERRRRLNGFGHQGRNNSCLRS